MKHECRLFFSIRLPAAARWLLTIDYNFNPFAKSLEMDTKVDKNQRPRIELHQHAKF